MKQITPWYDRTEVRLIPEGIDWNDSHQAIVDKAKADEIAELRAAPIPQQPDPRAAAWAEGYKAGISDERTSEANIGIAGFNAKVEPARNNPYLSASPQPKDMK